MQITVTANPGGSSWAMREKTQTGVVYYGSIGLTTPPTTWTVFPSFLASYAIEASSLTEAVIQHLRKVGEQDIHITIENVLAGPSS